MAQILLSTKQTRQVCNNWNQTAAKSTHYCRIYTLLFYMCIFSFCSSGSDDRETQSNFPICIFYFLVLRWWKKRLHTLIQTDEKTDVDCAATSIMGKQTTYFWHSHSFLLSKHAPTHTHTHKHVQISSSMQWLVSYLRDSSTWARQGCWNKWLHFCRAQKRSGRPATGSAPLHNLSDTVCNQTTGFLSLHLVECSWKCCV